MKADILTLKQIFQKDVRYLIPTFQRPFVWTQEEQWEPLWDDVRNTAERYIDQLEMRGNDRQAQAESSTAHHFLGAIVLQQQPTAAAEIEARTVIDGQQRLTTLQLLLDAAQEVYERVGAAPEAKRLSRLVLNNVDFVEDQDDVFKIWPTAVDRDAFRLAMSNDLPTGESWDSNIVQAHEFFQLQVQQWLDEKGDERSRRAHALETTLIALLQMVVIDLDGKDDEHVIFETLNARGTPLLASDLIKNLVLFTAGESGKDEREFHSKYWKDFDEMWWRQEVRQGRLVRPRVDVFLNYWLVMETGEEVNANRVFPEFRTYLDRTADVEAIATELKKFGEVYKELEQDGQQSVVETFLYRWRIMQVGVITPVLIWLFAEPKDRLPTASLERSLKALESYLLRRMVCRMTTKDYNRLFLELLVQLKAETASLADDVIVSFLGAQTADAREWPSNEQVQEAFLNLPLYRLLTRSRLRIVLEGIENTLRTSKAEEKEVPRGLTIEHVMPRKWQENWPLAVGSEAELHEGIRRRNLLIHSVGNLTLVNNRLNPALSNSAWPRKREILEEHSVLYLNKALTDPSDGDWDEDRIHERGRHLFEKAVSLWPGPKQI